MNKWLEVLNKVVPDQYDRHARLYPMLLLLSPIVLCFWGVVPKHMYDWEAILGLVLWLGFAYFFKELGRESGKNKELALWEKWGGCPSTQYLRHRGSTNPVTLKRIHRNLRLIVQGMILPTQEEESADPVAADNIYDDCARIVRQRTRSTADFPLLFKELCSYGFWRNTWGLKKWGLCLTLVSFIVIVFYIVVDFRQDKSLASYNPVVCLILISGILLFWFTLHDNRIKLSAFAYAERLYEATEQLKIAVSENCDQTVSEK